MFKFLDLDANGLISWEEFDKCCRAMCSLDGKSRSRPLTDCKTKKEIPKNIQFDQHGRARRVNLLEFEVE